MANQAIYEQGQQVGALEYVPDKATGSFGLVVTNTDGEQVFKL